MTPFALTALDPVIDAAVERILDLYKVPGAVIAAVQGDKFYLKPYGVKSVTTKAPVTDLTAFNIASNSKAFVSAAVARLVDMGRLSWDDPIKHHVPEIDFNDPWMSKNATLRDLCANRTGLQRLGLVEFGANADISVKSLLARAQFIPSLASFRTRFTYMNIAHMAVAAAVERVAGCTFLEFITKEIFHPLGMNDSSGGRRADRLSDVAHGHAQYGGDNIECQNLFSDTYLGASSLYLCGRDALSWIKFHVQEGLYADQKIIEPASLRETHSAQTVIGKNDRAVWLGCPDSPIIAYGLGWAISTFAGHKLICHAGLETGTTAQTSIIPDAGVGVAIYANNISPAPQILSYMMLDALLKRPAKDWNAIVTDPSLPSPLPAELQPFLLANIPAAQTLPPSALEKYCGEYQAPTSGDASLDLKAGKLRLNIYNSQFFSGSLIPVGTHHFVLDPDDKTLPNVLGGYPCVDFHTNETTVTGFHIPWLGNFSITQASPIP